MDRCGVCGGDGGSCNLKAVYVRWGRSDCPNGTKMLFSGHAAGYILNFGIAYRTIICFFIDHTIATREGATILSV